MEGDPRPRQGITTQPNTAIPRAFRMSARGPSAD